MCNVGQRLTIGHRVHDVDEKFSEDATLFAERTIELVNLLAGDGR